MLPNKNNIFRGKNPHIDDILTNLNKIHQYYKKIFVYLTQDDHAHHAVRGGQTKHTYKSIFSRGDGDLTYNLFQDFLAIDLESKIKQRGTPILNGKFVVFTKLNDGTNLQLIDALQSYHEFLVEKMAQLASIVDCLEIIDKNESGSDEYVEAKKKLKELIEHRVLQKVSPIAFDYPHLDTSNEINRNKQIDEICETISQESKYRNLVKGKTLISSMRSYNYHVAEQLFTVLYACELLSVEDIKNIGVDDESVLRILQEIKDLYNSSDGRGKVMNAYEQIASGIKLEDKDASLRSWLISAIRDPIKSEREDIFGDSSNGVRDFIKKYYGIIAKHHANTLNSPLSKAIQKLNDLIAKKLGKDDYVPYLCENLIVDNGTYLSEAKQGSSGNITVYTKDQISSLDLGSFKYIPTGTGVQVGIIHIYITPDQIANMKAVDKFGSGKTKQNDKNEEIFKMKLKPEDVNIILNDAKNVHLSKAKPSIELIYKLASIVNQDENVSDIVKVNSIYYLFELADRIAYSDEFYQNIKNLPGFLEKIAKLMQTYGISVPRIKGSNSRFELESFADTFGVESYNYDKNTSNPMAIKAPLIYRKDNGEVVQALVADTELKPVEKTAESQNEQINPVEESTNKTVDTEQKIPNLVPDNFNYNEDDLTAIKDYLNDDEIYCTVTEIYSGLNDDEKEVFVRNFHRLKGNENLEDVFNDLLADYSAELNYIRSKMNELCK